jgi:N-acetylglucosaminyl-diphospho-decaprenol L-rhamnosyltransferase
LSIPEKSPEQVPVRVLVVIVNYKSAGLTIACLRSLEAEIAENPFIRVTVVENDSGDGDTIAAAILERGWGAWASLKIAERNGGFAYGNNRGIEPTLRWPEPPDYYFLLNPDTEIRRGAVRMLVEYMDEHPAVGIAGSSLESQDGSVWPYAYRFQSILSEFEDGIRFGPVSRMLQKWAVPRAMGREPAEVDWVAGASLMIRRKVFEDIGLMDEGYFLYYEEVDYCLQARRAGWPCWYVPQSRVMHISGQSTGVPGGGTPRTENLKRMPAYWFDSRSRYFVKNHGLAYARLADLAFGVGRTLWTLRRLLSRRPREDAPWFLADFWRTSVLFQTGRKVRQRIDGQSID